MCEWQQLRARLNHDWLKNEYLKNLDGLIVQMKSSRRLDATLESQIKAYLSAWKRKYSEMEDLLSTAEDNLSPRSLFESEPLIYCMPEHKVWLAPLVHGLWLFRSGIREKVAEARRFLSDADRSHEQLGAKFKKRETAGNITAALEVFTDIVKQLSRLLSSFPDKVVTT